MKKQILLTVLLVLAIVLSVSAISASEVNVTDSQVTSLVDDAQDVSVSQETTEEIVDTPVSSDSIVDMNDSSKGSLSSEEVLESDSSNTLSTNVENDTTNLSSTNDNQIVAGANKNINIAVSGSSVYYKGTLKVTLKNDYNKVVSGKEITVIVGGKTYHGKTNNNGIASVNLDVSPGKYSVTLKYGGDNLYGAKKSTATINILPTIKSKAVAKYYKGSTKYAARFFTSQGKALANTNVKITVKGKTYTRKTDSYGIASMDINLAPGTYKITSTDPKTGYKLTNTFKILSTISADDVSKVYTDGKKFSAKFYQSNGKALANARVTFDLAGGKYYEQTDGNGVATVNLAFLKSGYYKIVSHNSADGLSKANNVKVYENCKSKLTAYSYTFLTTDATKIVRAILKNEFGYAPGSGKEIKFTVDGKTYTRTTNSNGVAALTLPSDIDRGVHVIDYKFEGNKFYKASSASSRVLIIPTKTPTLAVESTTTFGYGSGAKFAVSLTSGGIPLANKLITFNLDGKTYNKVTNSKGIAYLPINLAIGKYTVTYSNKGETNILSLTQNTAISVVKKTDTNLKWKSETTFYKGVQSYKVLLTTSDNKVLSGKTVSLTINSKTYTTETNSDGYALFKVTMNVNPGTYDATYKFAGGNLYGASSGKTSIIVKNKDSSGSSSSSSAPKALSIVSILGGASKLKSYYEKNGKFPTKVYAGGHAFTLAELLYMMEKAIYQLGNSNKNSINCMYGVKAPSKGTGDAINKELYKDGYVSLAKSVSNYFTKYKKAPTYANSALGKIAYSELLDTSSRVLTYYATNKAMPNYVMVNYGSSSSSSAVSAGGLNVKNTITNLAPYLQATTNCQVGYSTIKNLVNSLTRGLTSDTEKASAIYNYVRDQISYSFYYDTAHGAAGTLSAGSGNCVDQAHLVIAMFRTAGLPARYEHGTCTFTLSGSTYGHVWAQVLVNNVWVVCDPTSSRNSYGQVINWDTGSYSHHSYYASLPF